MSLYRIRPPCGQMAELNRDRPVIRNVSVLSALTQE